MNGTQKDIEYSKKFFAGDNRRKEQIKDLRKELQRFILLQCPGGWTAEQCEMLTLEGLFEAAMHYAGGLEE